MRRALILVLVTLMVVEGLRSLTYISPQYTKFEIREKDLISAWKLLDQLSIKDLDGLRNSSGYEVLIPTPDGGLRMRCGS